MAWQYKVDTQVVYVKDGISKNFLQDLCDVRGKDYWELVSVCSHPAYVDAYILSFYWKRSLKESAA